MQHNLSYHIKVAPSLVPIANSNARPADSLAALDVHIIIDIIDYNIYDIISPLVAGAALIPGHVGV